MKISDLAKKMIITILAIALLSILGSLFFYRSLAFIPFLFGVVLGSASSISKVFLLESTVDKAIKMEVRKAKNYVSVQHILRLLLSGAVLVIGALLPQISLWGVAAGVLAFHPAIYIAKFLLKN